MRILAIESSSLVASVAIADENGIIAEYTTNYKKTHSVTLMPMVSEILNITSIDLKTVDLIGVSKGPGSFTGLRIGSATVKGLAHALNLPIASVPTLEVLANNIDKTDALICPMMDARRQQVYTGLYSYEGNNIIPVTEMMATDIETIIKIIKSKQKDVIFLGDGIKPNKNEIEQLMGDSKYYFASPQNNFQRAASLAICALRYEKEGKLESYMEHVPIYLRKSQAEREYEEKYNKQIE